MTDAEVALNVRRRFAFLEELFCFQCECVVAPESNDDVAVRYTSLELSLEVFLSRTQGNEVGVRFWACSDTSRDYSFHTFLQLVDLSMARSLGYSMAKDDGEICELLSLYQGALRTHGQLLLRGDSAEFERARKAEEDGIGLVAFEPSTERFCGESI